ncbi:hypothetical protein ACWYEE_002230 [Klebsiella variicola]
MTDTVIKPEEISDALFSCVYSWVNGHAIDKKGADAAVARHRDRLRLMVFWRVVCVNLLPVVAQLTKNYVIWVWY